MPNRACQFAPFDALEGFQKELRKEEIEKEQKPILSIDQIDEINQELNSIQVGDLVKISYFQNKKKNITGIITKMNPITKTIKINHLEIEIFNIIMIEKQEEI